MSLDIALSGISIITNLGEGLEPLLDGSNQKEKVNPKIDPVLFADTLSNVDTGLYELHRIQKLSAIAFIKALSMSGINISELNSERIAIFLGNSYGIEEFKTEFFKKYRTSAPSLINPSLFPYTTANSIAAWLAIQFGIRGINLTLTNGCTAGSEAIIAGCDSIASGKADIAVVEGVNFLCDDLKDDFYRSGFRQEIVGALVLEKKESVISSGRRVFALIEDFKHGFLFEEDIQKLNNINIPTELKDNDAETFVVHLGNSFAENKFTYYNNIQDVAEDREMGFFSLNNLAGNAFSASGVLGLAFSKYLFTRNGKKVLFIDVDSHGSYVKFNVGI